MRHFICLSFILFGLSGCAPNPQMIQNQNLAVTDTELMVLDFQNQDPMSARMHLNEAKSLAPNDPHVLIAEGYFDLKMGDAALAEQQYTAAISAAPNDPQIQNDYGTFLYAQKEYKEALQYFLKAAQNPLNAISAEAFENAGLAEMKLGQLNLAQQYFVQAGQEDPNLMKTEN